MRFSYRLKILVSLLSTTLLLLGGALFAVDRAYQARVESLTRSRVAQGERNFAELVDSTAEELQRHLALLAKSARLQLDLHEHGGREAVKLLLDDMETNDLRDDDYVLVAVSDGKPVVRLLHKPGAPFLAGAKPPLVPSQDAVVAGGRHVAAGIERKDDEDELISGLNPWIVEEGRLFQVYARKVTSGESFVGVLVCGREMTQDRAMKLKRLQQEADDCAYVVHGQPVAASLPQGRRDAVGKALIGHLGAVRTEFDAEIEGHPYRIVTSPVQAAIHSVLFISLKELTDFRRQVRYLILGLGGIAVLVSLFFSILISRGVTRPVADLAEGTVKIAKGEYGTRIRVRSRDELGDLAGAFNQMAEDLAQKEKVRAVLNKVVAPEIAEELMKGDLSLGGDLVRPTILFADLRGFTALTQGMPPQKVVSMLNEFMTAMTEEVLSCKGIVDKYVGDEIIGLFGVPTPRGADALAGVEAAHRMRLRLEKLNKIRAGRGERVLHMGIGIHTGEVVAGRMGSEQQLSYTCIGENMNLASRLCSNAKPGQILMSIDTYRDAGDAVEARPLDPIQVKGFDKPVPVYEVTSVMIGATAMRRKR